MTERRNATYLERIRQDAREYGRLCGITLYAWLRLGRQLAHCLWTTANTQPVTTVVKLANVGAVIVAESPCISATNPGTSSMASFLARSVWS